MHIEDLNVSLSSILALLGAEDHIVKIVKTTDFGKVEIQKWQQQELTCYHHKLIDIHKGKIVSTENESRKLEHQIMLSETDY